MNTIKALGNFEEYEVNRVEDWQPKKKLIGRPEITYLKTKADKKSYINEYLQWE